MQWANYLSATDGRPHAALVVDASLHALPVPLSALLEGGHEALRDAAAAARRAPWEVVEVAEAAVLAPVTDPPSVRDFMAFENHVVTSMAAIGAEVNPVWYEQPAFYFTNPACIRGPGQDVPLAPGTTQYDYELEVAAIVGAGGADLDPSTAEAHIAGFTILCDWSARDLQAKEMGILLGPAKGKDTATSLGPFLTTPDELEPFRKGNGYELSMTATVNGRTYSAGNWVDLYWSFGQMLAYASRGTRLRPGDVIGSGTVGTGCILELSRVHGADAYPWLRAGDEVCLTVDRLGTLVATIVAGAEVKALS